MSVSERRHPRASGRGVLLGRCQPDAADIAKLHVLPRFPKIMVVLHGEPAFGRAAQGLGQTQRHFRTNAARSGKNAVQSRRSDTKLGREYATAQYAPLDCLKPQRGLLGEVFYRP